MIAGNITRNWVFEKKDPEEIVNKALRKANEIEKTKLSNGWRWKKIYGSTTILVPCDKKGNPTNEGAEMIAKYKEMFRIP